MHRSILVAAGLVATSLAFVQPGTSVATPPSSAAKVGKPSVKLEGQDLVVRGTSADERIVIQRKPRRFVVLVEGRKLQVPRCTPRSTCFTLRVLGLGGDDRITVRTRPLEVPLPVELIGGKGDDVLTGGNGSADWDVLDGGKGDDLLIPRGGTDELRGGSGGDTYLIDGDVNGQQRIIETESGAHDHVSYAPTTKGLTVGIGPDGFSTFAGSSKIEYVTGGSGDDDLSSSSPSTHLNGGPGDDRLSASGGDDVLSGDAGDDVYQVCAGCGPGSATFEASDGDDTVELFNGFTITGIQFRLDTTTPQQVSPSYVVRLSSSTAFRNVIGTSAPDTLAGNSLDNRMVGSYGDDVLEGAGGSDTFVSGFEDDAITDFTSGVDTVELAVGLSVHSGLGTSILTIWNGETDGGTVTASNGHVWQAEDFS